MSFGKSNLPGSVHVVTGQPCSAFVVQVGLAEAYQIVVVHGSLVIAAVTSRECTSAAAESSSEATAPRERERGVSGGLLRPSVRSNRPVSSLSLSLSLSQHKQILGKRGGSVFFPLAQVPECFGDCSSNHAKISTGL